MICYFLHTSLSTSLPPYLSKYIPLPNRQENKYLVYGPVVSSQYQRQSQSQQCQIKKFQFYTYMYLLTFEFPSTSYLLLINKAHPQAFPALFPQTSGSTT